MSSPSEFADWVEHFEQNGPVHDRTDADIRFDGRCLLPSAVRGPLIESVRRFQLGAISYRRTRFVRHVLADFATVTRDVFAVRP